MKKLLLTVVACVSFVFASAQNQLGVFSMSGNINYGTEIESLGIGLRTQYGFADRLRGSLEYKYYIDRRNWSEWEINADAHYLLTASETVFLYPIGGLKFSRWTFDPGRIEILGVEHNAKKTSKNRLGLNLGFGGQIAMGENVFIQPEIKYEFIKDFSQFVFGVGFMYQF